jgi:GDSL-like Lipase/Acylhydrolase family
MTTLRLRETLQGALLALVSTALTLGAVEGVCRFSVSRAVARSQGTGSAPLSRFDPLRGWANNPGAERRLSRGEFDVTIRINSHGLRGPERDYARPAGVRRVLILGDSFAEGYYAEEPQTARARLEAALGAGCPSPGCVQVINAGAAGYSTDQELLLYEQDARRYQADLVLLFFYANDLYFDTVPVGTANKPKPVFTLLSRWELKLESSPVPPPAAMEPGEEEAAPAPRSYRGSVALELLSERTLAGSPRLHRILAGVGLVPEADSTPAGDFLPYCPVDRAERWRVDDMWNRTSAILLALRRAVEADHARLAVLYVPALFEADGRAWAWIQERYPGRPWSRNAVYDRLDRFCHELEIPLVDPRPELRRAEQSQAPAYLRHDGHWNARGNAIAASVLERELRARGLLDGLVQR